MTNVKKIENAINNIKEINQDAGNELHTQMHHAQNVKWTREDLSTYMKSDNDIADIHYCDNDAMHEAIREIQDDIIMFYGED